MASRFVVADDDVISEFKAGPNFLGKIFVERFRFIFSFLRGKNKYVFQF
jgi:hypothetical protein